MRGYPNLEDLLVGFEGELEDYIHDLSDQEEDPGEFPKVLNATERKFVTALRKLLKPAQNA